MLNFSPDYSRLYYGTYSGNGRVYYVDLDVDLNPVGEPVVLATGVGSGDYHDSMGVDACGNLYVADFARRALYRISPKGNLQLYHQFSSNEYGHGLEWGSGEGGWKSLSVYMPQPYHNNRVIELDIGVPSRHYPGPVNLVQ